MKTQGYTENEILSGFRTASIDSTCQSSIDYRPEFLSNDHEKGRKVLVSLERELENCDSFKISVAFITMSGITPLLQVFRELENRGISGQILTTDYLSFTEPKALEKLSQMKNIEVRMLQTNEETGGFHTKGYIFQRGEIYHIIIGSSNMTLSAVTRNREWNAKFVTTAHGEMSQDILHEFNDLWNDVHTKRIEECLDAYQSSYFQQKTLRKAQQQRFQAYSLSSSLKPNAMQIAFIDNVIKMRKEHVHKALLLSSTGTGKTYASAFAMKRMQPKRLLFIVHREQIAKQAMATYKRVFGNQKSYGLLSGNSHETHVDFLFSTMQMMSKQEIYQQFSPSAFDVIVLDECHHAGATSYQKIMQYFQPDFWLGMTASPDTTNYDIYRLFDHNIAYEIRLQQALEENLLCPFHYFGITDLTIHGETFDDQANLKNFSNLVCEERVSYILKNAEYFGYSGNRVKGLIFCSRKEEAYALCDKFNVHKKKNGTYYRTRVLTGENSQQEREEAIEKLVRDSCEDTLDYIFTVDIFNEGVDIPEINQVIMLRPTESPVVFIQQLGRGLRKYDGKEYVVILDFIGNYTNNYMIPIALSGDRTYNKDTMRRYVMEGARIIPGSSTIHFDEISKKRIFASIDAARTNEMRLLKESYFSLKNKLGRIPSLREFRVYGSIDVLKIFDKCGSYYAFLRKVDPTYPQKLNTSEMVVLEFLSKKLVSFKRNYDVNLLKKLIIEHHCGDMSCLPCRTIVSIERNLMNEFAKEEERKKYSVCHFIEKVNGKYVLSSSFKTMLEHVEFRQMVLEVLDFAEERNQEQYSHTYKDTDLCLYQKYTYEDVCRLLGWQRNMNAQNIGGYFYDKETKTLPVFINYDKAEDAIAYEDRFVSENELIALSKHPRKVDSSDACHIYKMCEEDKENRIFLFVRKNKDDKETKEFYFLGEIFAVGMPKAIYMASTKDNAFEIEYHLDEPVRSDIYDYIVNG